MMIIMISGIFFMIGEILFSISVIIAGVFSTIAVCALDDRFLTHTPWECLSKDCAGRLMPVSDWDHLDEFEPVGICKFKALSCLVGSRLRSIGAIDSIRV